MAQVNIMKRPGGWVDAIHSPEDGGWWIHSVNGGESLASRKVYKTAEEARKAFESGKVRWER